MRYTDIIQKPCFKLIITCLRVIIKETDISQHMPFYRNRSLIDWGCHSDMLGFVREIGKTWQIKFHPGIEHRFSITICCWLHILLFTNNRKKLLLQNNINYEQSLLMPIVSIHDKKLKIYTNRPAIIYLDPYIDKCI